MSFELWMKDEYGQGSIIGRFEDIDKLVSRARSEVNNLNVDNALAADEKMNAWEAYFVDFFKKDKVDAKQVYAGNNPDGKHRVLKFDKGGSVSLDIMPDTNDVRLYLGNLNNKDWYAKDTKNNVIDSLSSRQGLQAVEGKTVFFARLIK